MKKLFISSIFIYLILYYSQYSAFAEVTPAPALSPICEISFGASYLDIDNAFKVDEGPNGKIRRYPVTSALFLGEWLAGRRFTVGAMINIPLGPQKVVRNGVLVEENVATAVGAGPTWIPLIFEPFSRASLEIQTGILCSTTVNSTDKKGNYLFPLVFARLKIVSRDGFSLYMGNSYAMKKGTSALLCGVARRF